VCLCVQICACAPCVHHVPPPHEHSKMWNPVRIPTIFFPNPHHKSWEKKGRRCHTASRHLRPLTHFVGFVFFHCRFVIRKKRSPSLWTTLSDLFLGVGFCALLLWVCDPKKEVPPSGQLCLTSFGATSFPASFFAHNFCTLAGVFLFFPCDLPKVNVGRAALSDLLASAAGCQLSCELNPCCFFNR